MLLIVIYITVWTVSPGPVCIKTIQEVRNNGTKAGVTIAIGATITAVLMVLAGLVIYRLGLSAVLDSSGVTMIEQIGAVAVILMGLYAAFKCLVSTSAQSDDSAAESSNRAGLLQGMGVMATGIPQALLVYVVMIPQSVELSAVTTTILVLGSLNVAMVFFFYSLVATITGRSQQMVRSNRFKSVFDFSLAAMLVGMGASILF
ncbi:MAG: LysE family transporter [Chloroflexota bacterium]